MVRSNSDPLVSERTCVYSVKLSMPNSFKTENARYAITVTRLEVHERDREGVAVLDTIGWKPTRREPSRSFMANGAAGEPLPVLKRLKLAGIS